MAESLLVEEVGQGGFPLCVDGKPASILIDAGDHAGVRRAAGDLAADIERVTGVLPARRTDWHSSADLAVIVGTLGRSPLVDELVRSGKLDVSRLTGQWESFLVATIDHPLPGIDRGLVIVGSDKRGTIYGLYEISEQIGVSPWYWWADVPVRHRASLQIKPGVYFQGPPAVRYRGIFINDEAPCLSSWAREKFGGFNSQFYAKVFELLLRLRGNYLWPAMWDNAFNTDDPLNPRLADEYGIVMGTSHHEPMMRAHKEWTSNRSKYGNGKWNYASNSEALKVFFREGLVRNADYENLITIGMRGDGDEGLVSTGSIESDMALLRRIFSDQRSIIQDSLKTDPAKVPQLWALFTEVQQFYEKGLRPPDDVTLLWTDDNTGNLRRLPTLAERARSGGNGIYYHIDMHGGPFAYQWINTNPLPKIAEQMNLAYEYGATRIWILNVGDIKPLELPLEFFLRQAWNPPSLSKDQVASYTLRWAERDFGREFAAPIAELVSHYAKYNGWRKPELIKPDTFSLLHYQEAERVEAAWDDLVSQAKVVYGKLPAEYRAAFYQLVLHPVEASAVVVKLNITAGRNQLYAKQGRASTLLLAAQARALFRRDRELSDYYNQVLSAGKWNHLMDQPHLGQFTWEPPIVDIMPPVSELLLPDSSRWGVSIEGDASCWPGHFGEPSLPEFDSLKPRRSYIDVFPMGSKSPEFSVKPSDPWIKLIPASGIGADQRYWVEMDWAQVPEGASLGTVTITGEQGTVSVKVPARKATQNQLANSGKRLASLTGPLAFSARATTRRLEAAGARWEEIQDYGRTQAALAVYPVTTPSSLPPAEAPTLEYAVYLPRAGMHELTLVLGPVMDFVPDRGMRIAVSFDDAPPQILDIFTNREAETFLGRSWWSQYTMDNARYLRSTHQLAQPGPHTLKLRMVDPGIVLQKVIISDRPVPPTYFGPPDCDTSLRQD